MLLRNESAIKFYVEINLYFDDGTEKHFNLNVGDTIKVTHRRDGFVRIDTGKLIRIDSLEKRNLYKELNEDCFCHFNMNPIAVLNIDTSKQYESEVERIIISDLIDVEILDTKAVPNKIANVNNIENVINNLEDGDVLQLSSGIYNKDLSINKSVTITGEDGVIINSSLEFTGGDVTLSDLIIQTKDLSKSLISNNFQILYKGTGNFNMINNSIIAKDSIRSLISCETTGKVCIENNIFNVGDGLIYNGIELCINKESSLADGSTIRNNNFRGKFKNNTISIYTVDNNSEIFIIDNYFENSNNAIRLSNVSNSIATFNIINNKYDNTAQDAYAGFILLQDYSKDNNKQSFTIYKIIIDNLIGPDGNLVIGNVRGGLDKQIYYVYSDREASILENTNQPYVVYRNK